jgi:hypothetical protein
MTHSTAEIRLLGWVWTALTLLAGLVIVAAAA